MKNLDDLSFNEFDEAINPRPTESDFDRVVDSALSRRDVLKSVIAFGGIAALGNTLFLSTATAAPNRFAFDAISTSTDDTLKVPAGYNAKVVVRWGDPLWSGAPEFDHASRGTGASQAKAMGDNNDGMEVYAHGDKTILICNNEYCNRKIIWGNREKGKAEGDDDYLKGMNAHGLTAVELVEKDGEWSIVSV